MSNLIVLLCSSSIKVTFSITLNDDTSENRETLREWSFVSYVLPRHLSGDVKIIPVTMLWCSVLLNMEWFRIHSLSELSLPHLAVATSA